MRNIVIEGNNEKSKKYIIDALHKKLLYKKIIIEDISSKRFVDNENYKKIIKEIKKLNIPKESKLEILDYLDYRQSRLFSSNQVNLLNKSYLSVLNNCNILNDKSSQKLVKDIKLDEKIDLLVFMDTKNKDEEFKSLKEYIRLNNHEFCLFAFNSIKDLDEIVDRIYLKILELLVDEEKNEMDRWAELYKIDVEEFNTPDDYINYKLKYKKKFIKKTLKYSNKGSVLEAGCGTGLMAGYLQKLGCTVTAGDISQKVLNLAKELAIGSSIIEPCHKYEIIDILNLRYKSKKFDVAVSNGALEHFSDYDIIDILKQQMIAADYVLFGIPSTYFEMSEKMLGNERSLKLKEWKNLIKKADGEIVESTSFHYYKFFRRLFEVKKWFKPKAFWLFVVKSKN